MNIDDIMKRTFEPLCKKRYAIQEDKQKEFQTEFDKVEIESKSGRRHAKKLQRKLRITYGVEIGLVNRDAAAMIEGRK